MFRFLENEEIRFRFLKSLKNKVSAKKIKNQNSLKRITGVILKLYTICKHWHNVVVHKDLTTNALLINYYIRYLSFPNSFFYATA